MYHSKIYLTFNIVKRGVFRTRSNLLDEAFFFFLRKSSIEDLLTSSKYASGKYKGFLPINSLTLICVGFLGVRFAVCDGV